MKKVLILFLVSFSLTIFAQDGLSSVNNDSTIQQSYHTLIPYESVNGKIIIKVNIKGKPYRFILDTGSLTLISKRLYDELNLKIIYKVCVNDQSALKDSMNVVSVDEIVIGDFTFNNVEAFALKESNSLVECFNVDGFIGSNILSPFIVQISSPDKTVASIFSSL